MAYINGVVNAVSGSATALPNPGYVNGSMVVQNLSTSTVAYCGGPFVTADQTATGGIQLGTLSQSVNNTIVLPGRHVVTTPGDVTDAPYVRTAAGTAPIAFMIALL